MAGKVSQNANAVKTTKRTLKPRKAMRTTKQSTQAPVLENAYSQTSVIQNEYPQTPAHQDAHTQQLETRLSVAVQDHTQHAANMEMPAALTPYQRMRELLSVKKLDREAGPREIPTVDDLQKYLQSDRSVRIIIRMKLLSSRPRTRPIERMLTPCCSLSPCGTWKATRSSYLRLGVLSTISSTPIYIFSVTSTAN
ncbi:hypothetical protein PC116_g20833 [Phytophthora cactorum]|uniref:Uncharacterized protein n=1 Tax=Phytophthora cactorum TaxID=29920 RepID=A0A8T1F9B3_9STRA|nr:hypothetical protein PC112_g14631 [Phytophthora cactorum]KAG2888412.1 hypothetical protein PC114_g18425 [Phytophthora cactorum]KAG2906969.1 hypothetical protein PC115_g14086 [Phytophthora cactorum]KAG2924527.1 hypothetical protein PC117_g15394 [Phytophthora cactorum]KAG2970777.1 hypothetical protein PC118_g16675 [Phytophthora cactorum]